MAGSAPSFFAENQLLFGLNIRWLRKARNLCVGCMIEAVRSASKTIDIDNVNRVLMQPHWQKESDLVDY